LKNHYTILKHKKALSNFGVFIVGFENEIPMEESIEKKESAIKRIFKCFVF